MVYNAQHSDSSDLLYSEFLKFLTFIKSYGWHEKVKGATIGRMSVAYPSQKEHLHLRTLLTVKEDVWSYVVFSLLMGWNIIALLLAVKS